MQQAEQVPLTNLQKKELRRIGHSLNPLVLIGRENLADSVIEAIDRALEDHELIKVKILKTSSLAKQDAAAQIPSRTAAQLVQLIGKTLLLYRANPKKKSDQRIKV